MAAGEIMLTEGLKRCTWRLVERQTQQFSRGGSGPVVDLGDPFWEIDFRYENLDRAAWQALTAWVQRRQGAGVNFAAYRPDRKDPILKQPGDTETDFEMRATNYGSIETVRIHWGLDYELSVGDMVAYDASDGSRYVGEITEFAQYASQNAHAVVYPPRKDSATQAPNPALSMATGLFRMVTDSLQMSEPYDPKKSLSFRARQDERPVA